MKIDTISESFVFKRVTGILRQLRQHIQRNLNRESGMQFNQTPPNNSRAMPKKVWIFLSWFVHFQVQDKSESLGTNNVPIGRTTKTIVHVFLIAEKLLCLCAHCFLCPTNMHKVPQLLFDSHICFYLMKKWEILLIKSFEVNIFSNENLTHNILIKSY